MSGLRPGELRHFEYLTVARETAICEVVPLLYDTDDVQFELILPPDLDVSSPRPLAG